MGRIRAHQLSLYSSFDQIDGAHPYQTKVPDGSLLYPARRLHTGKVVYFNFKLAKEMGLIAENHPQKMNRELENKILETFNLRIINEYDQKSKVRFHPAIVKKNKYMATRYLQLQHADKQGRTSGDGRSIWNGVVEHKGKIWDVSSRGTGVTALSPGAVEAGKPLRSGSTAFGYGCGLADVDELYGAAIMAEIFHNNGINTERMLTIIDHGDGNGIGVRAGHNLFRPAHLFLHLKQRQWETLKQSVDFFIDRQYKNREWNFSSSHRRSYDLMLEETCRTFARFAAQIDREYIFAWLDWDGDNVLGNAGIIDYGSIRQFGLRHDEYRYDDVERFSTNLKEQKDKARLIVQVYAQLAHYMNTKEKLPLSKFKSHPSVKKFNQHFEFYQLEHFLKQIGLTKPKRDQLMEEHRSSVTKLFHTYSQLEGVKTKRRKMKVADGVNRPAILNMRRMLIETPRQKNPVAAKKFYAAALAKTASRRDSRPTRRTLRLIEEFQKAYWTLMAHIADHRGLSPLLKQVTERATEINRDNRITGDALLYVVDEILKTRRKQKQVSPIQEAIDGLIEQQSVKIDMKEDTPQRLSQIANDLMRTFITLVDGHKESI